MPEHIRPFSDLQLDGEPLLYGAPGGVAGNRTDLDLPQDGILLIDDNEDDAELSLRCLHKLGLDVPIIWLSDSAQAIDKLENVSRKRELPRLILLDLKMPRVNGLEVLKRLRAKPRLEGVAVIVMVSSSRDPEVGHCLGAGANSYVVKPLRSETFFAACERALLSWPDSQQS